MSHIAYQQNGSPDYQNEVDFIVVGSGPGGATFAKVLSGNGENVLIVEAGAWRNPEDYPDSYYGAMRDGLDNFGTTLAKGETQWPIAQAKLVGGGSVINSAICVRTPGDIFDLWQNEHGFGGDVLAKSVWEKQDKLESLLSVEETASQYLGVSNELALKAGLADGIENHVIRRFVKNCEGSGNCFQGCRKNKKQSMNVTFIPEMIQNGGTVVSCAPVRKVNFEGNKAVGVEGVFRHPQTHAKGARFNIRARKAIIVAASPTHSPSLLARSGVRHPALGQGFRAHPGGAVMAVYEKPVNMHFGATQGWASLNFRESKGLKLETLSMPLEAVAGRVPGGGVKLMERLKEFPYMANWVQVVRAKSVGTVRNGFFNMPDVRYGLDESDMRVFREGMYITAKLHFSAGARYVMTGIKGVKPYLAIDEVEQILSASLKPGAYLGVLSHLFGACTMGADDNRAVVDPEGRN